MYANSVLTPSVVFPTNSKFDSYLMYGIDNSKQLIKLTAAGIYSINLGTGTLEDTPVSIINRKDLNALIVITKNSFTL